MPGMPASISFGGPLQGSISKATTTPTQIHFMAVNI
jgi:hypothetical protein